MFNKKLVLYRVYLQIRILSVNNSNAFFSLGIVSLANKYINHDEYLSYNVFGTDCKSHRPYIIVKTKFIINYFEEKWCNSRSKIIFTN